MTDEQKEPESERTARRAVRRVLDTLVTPITGGIIAGAFVDEELYQAAHSFPIGSDLKYIVGAGVAAVSYHITRALFLRDPK